MAAITAREFNQYTSKAKEMAGTEPVFITERGVVRYVLMNIDDYHELKGSRRSLADLATDLAVGTSGFDLDDFLPNRSQVSERCVDLT